MFSMTLIPIHFFFEFVLLFSKKELTIIFFTDVSKGDYLISIDFILFF